MAVTVGSLAQSMKLDSDPADDAALNIELSRILAVGQAVVTRLAADAPEEVRDECQIRFATYLFNQPPVGRRDALANAWVNSGAGGLASLWRPQAASKTADSD